MIEGGYEEPVGRDPQEDGPEQELKRQGIWGRLEKIAGRPLEWKDGSWTPGSVNDRVNRRLLEMAMIAKDFSDGRGQSKSASGHA